METAEQRLDREERERLGLFEAGALTAKGRALVEEDAARRRQEHGERDRRRR